MNHLIFNTTPSAALGIWKLEEINVSNLSVKELIGKKVAFCPSLDDSHLLEHFERRQYLHSNQSHYCKNGFAPLIKTVLAGSNDTVSVNESNNITINGIPQAGLFISLIDSAGRTLPKFRPETLSTNRLWVASKFSRSFDSRYFGSINRSAVLGTVQPFLVWAEGSF